MYCHVGKLPVNSSHLRCPCCESSSMVSVAGKCLESCSFAPRAETTREVQLRWAAAGLPSDADSLLRQAAEGLEILQTCPVLLLCMTSCGRVSARRPRAFEGD